MVNLLNKDLTDFMSSGVIIRDSEGIYWFSADLFPVDSTLPLGPKFWVQNFFGEPQAWMGRKSFTASSFELLQWLEPLADGKPDFTEEKTASHFPEFFKLSKEAIERGEISKVVSYDVRSYSWDCREGMAYLLASFIRHSEATGSYLYGFWKDGQGFMGSTPEVLFQKRSTEVKTMALAGTRSLDLAEELLKDPKEMGEHRFVIKGITESLEKYGEVQVEPTQLRKLAKLAHLETEIYLKNNRANFSAVMQALHPTPALGGYPKKSSFELLKKFDEVLPRENFGAPFGLEHADGDSLAVVMIRGVRWKNSLLQVLAGCGVVSESVFEKENAEIELKLSSIQSAAGISVEGLS